MSDGEMNESDNLIKDVQNLLTVLKFRGALKELQDRYSMLIDSILKEPFPAKMWLKHRFSLKEEKDKYYANLDSIVRKRAVYTRFLMHLSSRPYPVVGGFVRDYVIPIKDDNSTDTDNKEVCNDLDIVVPTIENALMLAEELKYLMPKEMSSFHWRREKADIYPFESIRMFFEPQERHSVSGFVYEPIGVDIIVASNYVATDFKENDIAFYPPLNIPTNMEGLREWDLSRIARKGKLVASQDVVDNIRAGILTIKEPFLETIHTLAAEARKVPEDADNSEIEHLLKYQNIMYRLQRGFYRNAGIYLIDENGERIKIKERGAKDFLLADLVL